MSKMAAVLRLLTALSLLAAGNGSPVEQRSAALPPKASVLLIGPTRSNFNNIYRDGGGGGTINGKNFMIFSDGIYTDGRVPNPTDTTGWKNFTSNSLACSNCDGVSGVNVLQDFGTADKGPLQQIPYFYKNGESDSKTGVWPNQGIATLCDGTCGVSFPTVVNRTGGTVTELYNTGIRIHLTAYGPVVERPVQALFRTGEPLFGKFGTFVGIDGYLYMFAGITHLGPGRNGLKMARVPSGSWSDRSQYQYWSGTAWTTIMPAYDDGGKANTFNFTVSWQDVYYGPGTGDLFYSQYYGRYLLVFTSDVSAIDRSVYLSYSSSLSSGWSTPQVIYTLPGVSDGYNYGFHAYSNYDSTGKTLPLSWSQWSTSGSYKIIMANVTFS